MQIRQRSCGRVPDVASTSDAELLSADEQRRHIAGGVLVRVAHSAAIEHDGAVQQQTVPVNGGPQLLHEMAQQTYVKRVEDGKFSNALNVPAMMREWMMRIRDADLRIGSLTELA